MISVFNIELVSQFIPQWKIGKDSFSKILQKEFANELRDRKINLIFSTKSEITKLNLDFRNVTGPTDVLSFEYEDNEVSGELYVCPEYITQTYEGKKAIEEIMRVSVHGLLHLLGHSHTGEFNEDSQEQEEMFVKQEEILGRILKEIN